MCSTPTPVWAPTIGLAPMHWDGTFCRAPLRRTPQHPWPGAGSRIGITTCCCSRSRRRLARRLVRQADQPGLRLSVGFPGLLLAVLAVSIFGVGLLAPVIAITLDLRALHRTRRAGRRAPRAPLPYVQAYKSRRNPGVAHHHPASVAGAPAHDPRAGHGVVRCRTHRSRRRLLHRTGNQAPTPEWGVMVAEGQASLLNGHPAQSLTAGGLIVLTVVAFNILGERLTRREEFEAVTSTPPAHSSTWRPSRSIGHVRRVARRGN